MHLCVLKELALGDLLTELFFAREEVMLPMLRGGAEGEGRRHMRAIIIDREHERACYGYAQSRRDEAAL